MTESIVSKLEAAIRQLDCAIDLYFQGADEVAIHTLACAAHQVIDNINHNKKGPKLLFDRLNHVLPSDSKISKQLLHKQYNFFKHADKDPCPDCGIRFNPELSKFFILSAILGIFFLNESINKKQSAFVVYFQIHNVGLLCNEFCHLPMNFIPADIRQELATFNRSQFFKTFIRACR